MHGNFISVRWRQVVGGIALLLAAPVILLALYLTDGNLGEVRETVQAAGIWAPLVFVLLQGVITVVPVPRTVFTVAAGVLFGGVGGVLLAVAGTTLAAAFAYWLVLVLGARFAERHAKHRVMSWLQPRLERSGLLAMVSLRLLPAIPFSAMNYASALSGVRFGPYLVGCVVGVLPGTIAIVTLGDAAVGGNPHPAMLLVSVISGTVGITGALIAARRPLKSSSEG